MRIRIMVRRLGWVVQMWKSVVVGSGLLCGVRDGSLLCDEEILLVRTAISIYMHRDCSHIVLLLVRIRERDFNCCDQPQARL